MSNSVYTGELINLDTFSSALTIPRLKIWCIEWVQPEDIGDCCLVKIDSDDGLKLIDWACSVQFKGEIKYLDPKIRTLYIPVGGVESGELIIHVR